MGEKPGEQFNNEEEIKGEVLPVEQREVVPIEQPKMPEDFVEPEGKSGKWGKPIKGEVEVEGKKVEVSYREKVIEIPKHRQEETGIKRICRRELLPPLPDGLHVKTGNSERYLAERKFDEFYKFFTDDNFPADETWVHIFDYLPVMKNTQRFKREGLYFQPIYRPSGWLYYSYKRPYNTSYRNPVFIFKNNEKFTDYLERVGTWGLSRIPRLSKSFEGLEGRISVPKDRGEASIQWCNAGCALVPTKRSLNVLFFETGDEAKGNIADPQTSR